MTAPRVVMPGLLLALLSTSAGAQAPAGSAQLGGKLALAATGCGAAHPSFIATATFLVDGTWTAVDSEGHTFDGTLVARGSSGRAFDLYFDAETESDLAASVAEDVGTLCDRPGEVTVTSATRKRFTLQLNRALTKAKLVLRYVFKGRAGNRSGSARYRVRAKGPFAPAT